MNFYDENQDNIKYKNEIKYMYIKYTYFIYELYVLYTYINIILQYINKNLLLKLSIKK
jgi:hypothetical protein